MSKQLASILPGILKNQMLQVTGVPGSGKTHFSINLDLQNRVCLADMELHKRDTLTNQYPLIKSTGLLGKNRYESVDNLINFVNSIKKGERTVLVLDNFVDFEDCVAEWVYRNAEKIVEKHPNMSAKMIRAMNQGFGQYYEAIKLKSTEIFHLIFDKFDTLVCTAHLSPVFKQPGKFKVKGRPMWLNYSVLSLILMKSDRNTERHAIVYKESISKHAPVDPNNLTEKQLSDLKVGIAPSTEIVRVIPPRIPNFSADKLRYLIHHPIGDNLSQDHIPSQEEIDPFNQLMSSDQIKALYDLSEAIDEKEAERSKELEQEAQRRYNDMIDFIKSELSQEKLPKDVIESAKSKFPEYAHEVDMPMVVGYM